MAFKPLDWFLGFFSLDIGIDLGTANTLVNFRGKGITINEPSWVAIDKRTRQPLAIGAEAREMVGRTPANVVAVRPLRDGVISEFEMGTADEVARWGVTVLAYDRRGSGRSGGPLGHVPSAEAFLEDLAAAHEELARVLAEQGAPDVPLHALANCFGTRILLPYLQGHPAAFRSAVLTAPATKMSRAADYRAATKLRVIFAAAERRFPTPLEDQLFVSSGPFLEWIRDDSLSQREVTARFLRATRTITCRMKKAGRKIETPLLVVLGSRDAMVVNAKIRSDFVARYRGPVEVLELDSEHYIDFTDQQPALAAAIVEWVRAHSAGRAGR